MTPQELATMFRLRYNGSCNCDGYETHIWMNNQGQGFKWRKSTGVAVLVKGRGLVLPWFKISELKNKLTAIIELENINDATTKLVQK